MAKKAYEKLPLSGEQHLQLLTDRKLIINNPEQVLHFLKYIGYYRLSGYALPFQIQEAQLASSKHTFRDGVTFEMVLELYLFDRELRLLVMDAIERVEVAVRAAISNTLCVKYDPHWFMCPELFKAGFHHGDFLTALKRELQLDPEGKLHKSKDVFLRHYFENYNSPELPPCWMISEILTIGKWSILYNNIKLSEDRAAIAQNFGLHQRIFSSWLHALSYLRNLCAHHARLWNRYFAITPRVMDIYRPHLEPNHTFSAQCAMLHILLKSVSPESSWSAKLQELQQKHPNINIADMGFAAQWHADGFWN